MRIPPPRLKLALVLAVLVAAHFVLRPRFRSTTHELTGDGPTAGGQVSGQGRLRLLERGLAPRPASAAAQGGAQS